jgi:hypothetical protein
VPGKEDLGVEGGGVAEAVEDRDEVQVLGEVHHGYRGTYPEGEHGQGDCNAEDQTIIGKSGNHGGGAL